MPPRKRQRVAGQSTQPEDTSLIDDDEDQYTVRLAQPRPKGSKKRRRGASAAAHHQDFAFFDARLSTDYSIRVKKHEVAWSDVKKYNKFRFEAHSPIEMGQVIYVKQEQDSGPKPEHSQVNGEDADENANDWVAKILECRAVDQQHVYLLVAWLYRPEDIPGGRQPHHGRHEVIATNDLQIIDAMTVNGLVDDVQYLNEEDDGALNDGYEDLVWRQTLDVRSRRLSQLRRYCVCRGFANPDVPLIRCDKCMQWMHPGCIVDAAERGDSSAPAPAAPAAVAVADAAPAAAPPAEAKPSPDEKVEENGARKSLGGAIVSLFSSLRDRHTPASAEPEPEPEAASQALPTPTSPQASSPNSPSAPLPSRAKGGQKKGRAERTARLLGLGGGGGDAGPLRIEITAVPLGKGGRKLLDGDAETWEEAVRCLLCGAQVE